MDSATAVTNRGAADRAVRLAAARFLRSCSALETVPLLVDALDSPVRDARGNAAHLLGRVTLDDKTLAVLAYSTVVHGTDSGILNDVSEATLNLGTKPSD